MSEFKQIRINNTKQHAILNGKWKDPGSKLYDQLLNAFYYDGDIPTDSKELEKSIKEGKYLQWDAFLKEAYLVAPVKDIKNSPYGVTPYSRSGCKYPHHVIKNGELVISIPGIKAVYTRAKQMGIFSGEVKKHLERHYKEMGIYQGSTMQINEKIEQNFDDIEGYILEATGIDLHCPTTLYEENIDNGVIRPLMKDDVTNPYFVDWLFRSYEFSDDDPEKFDYDMLVNNDTMGNYVYGYFVNDKLEGIIKVKYRKPEDYYAISMLFVNNQNESKGIGQSLMKYVIDKYGDKEMRLNVFEFNRRAMHIYKKYGFDVAASAVAKPEYDGDTNKLVGQKFYKMVRKPTEYDPPLSFDKLPDHLKSDPVHAWRAKTGIELIHKEPTIEELNRIWDNWNKMSDEQKAISDKKSMELFGKNNNDHYIELVREYSKTNEQSAMSIFPNGSFSEYKKDLSTIKTPEELLEKGDPDDRKYEITHKNSKYKDCIEYVIHDKDNNEVASCIVNHKTGDCANVETKPDYRHQGYMQYLLKYLIKYKGVKYIQVQQDNHIAISLYRKIGFDIEFKYNHDEHGPMYSMVFKGDASKLILEYYDYFIEEDNQQSLSINNTNKEIKESLNWIESFVNYDNFREKVNNEEGDNMYNRNNDDLNWIESYLMEEGENTETEEEPPSIDDNAGKEIPEESTEEKSEEKSEDNNKDILEEPVKEQKPEETETTEEEPKEEVKEEIVKEEPPVEEKPKKVSMPKQTDAREKDKNGVRRKKLYIAFIEWCKEYNNKNIFGSIFDKDAFKVSYPFVPDEMRYFYRLANPMLCVLGGQLTFFPVAELRKLNSGNKKLNEMMIFAATPKDVRVFNRSDKKVYIGTEENGSIKLGEVLGDNFDNYIQNMIQKGNILEGPIEESVEDDLYE